MYNVQHKYIVLEIPKNGSRSLVKASFDHHGKKWVKCQGHATYADLVTSLIPNQVEPTRHPESPVKTLAVFRNPFDRFYSQVAQIYRNKANLTLDRIMQIAWEQSDIVFKPQAAFVQVPQSGAWDMDLRMFSMERMEAALSYLVFLGGNPVAKVNYHLNKKPGPDPFTMDQILSHQLFDDIMETHYKDDFKWWLRAQKTNVEGKE